MRVLSSYLEDSYLSQKAKVQQDLLVLSIFEKKKIELRSGLMHGHEHYKPANSNQPTADMVILGLFLPI